MRLRIKKTLGFLIIWVISSLVISVITYSCWNLPYSYLEHLAYSMILVIAIVIVATLLVIGIDLITD